MSARVGGTEKGEKRKREKKGEKNENDILVPLRLRAMTNVRAWRDKTNSSSELNALKEKGEEK
jgi:hypothetical protein